MSDPADARPDVTPEWLEGHLATVFSRSHPRVGRPHRATSDAVVASAEIRPGECRSRCQLRLGSPVARVGRIVAVRRQVTEQMSRLRST